MSPGSKGSSWRRRVEHVDTDASGVVHFSRHAAFLETAALEALDATGVGLEELQREGLDLRVRELRLSYAGPARYRDWLVLDASIDHVGEARVRMGARCTREVPGGDAAPVVSGMIDFALVDSTSGRPATLPARVAGAWRGQT